MKLKIKNGGINDSQPDPYIIKANGKFYIYASGMGMPVKVYTAENPFGEWTRLPDVCYREGYGNFWAPSVIELDGKFYMYVSCMPNNSNDVHEQEMCVFVANAPEAVVAVERKKEADSLSKIESLSASLKALKNN